MMRSAIALALLAAVPSPAIASDITQMLSGGTTAPVLTPAPQAIPSSGGTVATLPPTQAPARPPPPAHSSLLSPAPVPAPSQVSNGVSSVLGDNAGGSRFHQRSLGRHLGKLWSRWAFGCHKAITGSINYLKGKGLFPDNKDDEDYRLRPDVQAKWMVEDPQEYLAKADPMCAPLSSTISESKPNNPTTEKGSTEVASTPAKPEKVGAARVSISQPKIVKAEPSAQANVATAEVPPAPKVVKKEPSEQNKVVRAEPPTVPSATKVVKSEPTGVSKVVTAEQTGDAKAATAPKIVKSEPSGQSKVVIAFLYGTVAGFLILAGGCFMLLKCWWKGWWKGCASMLVERLGDILRHEILQLSAEEQAPMADLLADSLTDWYADGKPLPDAATPDTKFHPLNQKVEKPKKIVKREDLRKGKTAAAPTVSQTASAPVAAPVAAKPVEQKAHGCYSQGGSSSSSCMGGA